MNLHQLKFASEVSKRGLNLTEAAKALHISQPGVSRAILELERELGIDLFVRHGKRLTSITEPGRQALVVIDRALTEIANLKKIADHYHDQDVGTLSIATTHTQARYVLPEAIGQLRKAFPEVNIRLHQGAPEQVAQMLIDALAEVGIATESLSDHGELVTLPCYEWQHVIVFPLTHALCGKSVITLQELANEPLVTYHPTFTGRTKIDAAFEREKLTPRIVLEAIDSDVIKTYVGAGLGIGILAEMAISQVDRQQFYVYPAKDLFGPNVTRIAFKRGCYLRSFVYAFAKLINPTLNEALIKQAMRENDL